MDRRNIQEVEPHSVGTPQRLAFILLAQKVINSLLLLRFNDALQTEPYSGSNTIFNLVTAAIRNDYKKYQTFEPGLLFPRVCTFPNPVTK